jgi:general secretion pathway protein A
MYLSYFGLTEKPFQITSDPKFLWLGEKHNEALSALRYGIMENKGFVLLTGEVGTGKTVLINRLTSMIDVDTIVATIPDPDLESLDFYKLLADGFKMKKTFMSKGGFLIHMRDFLHKSYSDKKQVLLIIDEAQRLSHKLLEEIRLLSNIELHDRKLINIFFVGQPEFKEALMESRNRAVGPTGV